MSSIVPAISGPKRPQDYVSLEKSQQAFQSEMKNNFKRPMGKKVEVKGENYLMESGKIVIASITCIEDRTSFVRRGS